MTIIAFFALLVFQKIEFAAAKSSGDDEKPCNVGGKIYQHRQLFVRSCNEHCMCYNGLVTCTSPCAHEFSPPPLDTCRDPRLVRIPGQCCQEWQCAAQQLATVNVNQSVGFARITAAPVNRNQAKTRRSQKQQRARQTLREAGPAPATTISRPTCPDNQKWSKCSTTCGPGVSTYYDCKLKKMRTRVCNIRPCSMVEDMRNNRCQATVKSNNSVLIHFDDCWTVRKFQPKYCGLSCNKSTCCWPREKSTKTNKAKFECLDGRKETYEIMWIKRCDCDAPC